MARELIKSLQTLLNWPHKINKVVSFFVDLVDFFSTHTVVENKKSENEVTLMSDNDHLMIRCWWLTVAATKSYVGCPTGLCAPLRAYF